VQSLTTTSAATMKAGCVRVVSSSVVERIPCVEHVIDGNVFLIGYGVVAGFNVGDKKPPHD
jgi:hypothetical protein